MGSCSMNQSLKNLLTAVVIVSFWVTPALADDAERTAARHLADGNRLLDLRRFDDALAAYDKAAEAMPRSAEVAYNRGIALYRLGRFPEAQTAFQNVLTRRRPALEANAKFNLGRSAQAAAMQKSDDLGAAVDDLGRAIQFYEGALQLKPDHAAAKKNMADAQRLQGFLKKIMELAQKEEKKEDGEKNSDESDCESQPDEDGEKDDKQRDGEPGDEEQNEDDQSDEDKNDPSTQPDAEREPSTQQSTQPTEQPESQPASQPATAPTTQPPQPATTQPAAEPDEQDIALEEAEKMLQEARDAERKRRAEKCRQRLSRQARIRVDKDW